MGVYSSFSHDDIQVTDKEGLKSFLENWAIANPNWWLNDKMKDSFESEDGFSFSSWDEIKLISYWYPIDRAFLHCVAKYIEGYADWEFENYSESGSVVFKDGECVITTGQMDYSDWKPCEDEANLDNLNKKTKRLMICATL